MRVEKPKIEPYITTTWQEWDGLHWVLVSDWEADIRTDFYSVDIYAKAGLVTDFGSIPWWYRWRINPTGKGIVGFLPHDCGYKSKQKLKREEWDVLMYDMLEWVGFSCSMRMACYAAVHFGGLKAWNENKAAEVKDLVEVWVN